MWGGGEGLRRRHLFRDQETRDRAERGSVVSGSARAKFCRRRGYPRRSRTAMPSQRTLNAGAFDDGLEGRRGNFFGLERLAGALHHAAHDLIERDEGCVGLGAHIDFPLSAVGPLERVTVARGEYSVSMNDDLAVFLLDGEELVAGTLAQRLGRLVGLVDVLRLGRQGQRCHNGDASLHARLPERGKEPHFIDRVQADALGYVAKKSLGRLDHAVALEACCAGAWPDFLSVSSRST